MTDQPLLETADGMIGTTTGRMYCHVSCFATLNKPNCMIVDDENSSDKINDDDLSSDYKIRPTNQSSKRKKMTKVYQQMQQRLLHDDCVINLVRSNLDDDGTQNEKGNRDNSASRMTGDTKNDGKQQGMVLLEGHVRQYYTRHPTKDSVSYQYEERVHTDGTVAEAIRRCVWSTNHEMMDIFDLLLQLPWLPTTTTTTTRNSSTHDNTDQAAVTLLANRLQLRLLEDAMVDACEHDDDEDDHDENPRKPAVAMGGAIGVQGAQNGSSVTKGRLPSKPSKRRRQKQCRESVFGSE
jgi:hypothetical protein